MTGAARRLGRALALALAEDGFDIALHVRRLDADAEEVLACLRAMGRRAEPIVAALDDDVATAGVLPAAVAALGPVGVLVNNAATFPDDTPDGLDAAGLRAVLDVDLIAPLVLARDFAAALPDGASGVIVNLLDQRILKPTGRRFSYTLAKSALFTATRMLARSLGPRIRVVGIGPGIALPDIDMDEATHARLLAKAPLGRVGSPEEIVAALRYLLRAPSVTGQMLTVDGGLHL